MKPKKPGFEDLSPNARHMLRELASPGGTRWKSLSMWNRSDIVECRYCGVAIRAAETTEHWCAELEERLKWAMAWKSGSVLVTEEQFDALDLAALAAIVDAHLNGEFDDDMDGIRPKHPDQP